MEAEPNVLVSIIIPCKNAEPWLDECLKSVQLQDHRPLELSIYDDGSTDNSVKIMEIWAEKLKHSQVKVTIGKNSPQNISSKKFGPGWAKNRAGFLNLV